MSKAHVQRAYELGLLKDGYKFTGLSPCIALNKKIERLESRINSKTFGTTSHLSHDKTFNKVRVPSSKVESFCLDGLNDKEELRFLTEIQEGYKKGFNEAKLSTLERKLTDELNKGPINFSGFAKTEGLCISYVYKIRDRAFKKIQKEVEKILYEL